MTFLSIQYAGYYDETTLTGTKKNFIGQNILEDLGWSKDQREMLERIYK